MPEWREVRLADVAEVTVGHVGPMASEYEPSGIPFLRSQNVLPHALDVTDVKFIGIEFHARLIKSQLQPGDVVTVRTGKPGTTAVVPSRWVAANCADLVITRTGRDLSPHWLSYYMNSVAKAAISAHLVGAVQQHFNVRSAQSLLFHLPPMAEQHAIVEVLGALDDKIAANAKLAQSAGDLAISHCSQVQEHVALGVVARQAKVTVEPAALVDERVWHFSLPAFDDGERHELARPQDIKSAKFRLAGPCILVSKLNPRIHRVWDIPLLPRRLAVASTEFVVLESDVSSTSVLWALTSQAPFLSALAEQASGTSGSHQRVRPSDLMATPIGDPRTIPKERQNLVTELGRVRTQAVEESSALAAVRDALLPHLMSGRLRVRDAEKIVGDRV